MFSFVTIVNNYEFNYMNFSDRLIIERERLGLKQNEFCSITGVGRTTQFHYESGNRLPDIDYLAKLASIGVDIVFLTTGIRGENTAQTAMELAYLRNCRTLHTKGWAQKGLDLLTMLREALGLPIVDNEIDSLPPGKDQKLKG